MISLFCSTVLVIVSLQLGQVSASDNSSSGDNSMCHEMAASDGLSPKGILCVGQLTDNKLIVISRDFFIYVLPIQSLDDTLNRLYINSTKPVELTKKWPKLVEWPTYVPVSKFVYNAFIWVSPVNVNYFFMTVKAKDLPLIKGIIYDIDHAEPMDGLYYTLDDNQVLIGSYMRNFYYAIHKNGTDQPLQMNKVTKFPECENVPKCEMTFRSDTWLNICLQGTTQIVMQSPGEKCDPVEWPVLNGFIVNDKVHLFGPKYLITFPEEAYTKKSVPVTFSTVNYNDFIQCDGTINVPFNEDAKAAAPISIGVIVAIVLIVVILLLCCILCLMREAIFGKKKKKKPTGKDSTSNKSVKGGSHVPGSARSKKLVSAGKLSRGGSAKGSKAHSARATARSGGSVAQPGKISPRLLNGSSSKGRHSATVTHRSGMKRSRGGSSKGGSRRGSRRSTHITDRSNLKH